MPREGAFEAGHSADLKQKKRPVLHLDQGIDFDAPDQQPVDLLFALVVPEHFTDEHLKILAYLAEMFSNQDFCQQLRASESRQQLYQQLIDWRPPGE